MWQGRFGPLWATLSIVLSCAIGAAAQGHTQQHSHADLGSDHVHRGPGPHGGVQVVAGGIEAEVVFHADAVDVYLRDEGHHHVEAEGVTGSVRVSFDDPARPVAKAMLAFQEGEDEGHVHHHDSEHCHERVRHGRLTGLLDLGRVGEGEVDVEVNVNSLPSDPNAERGFSVPFRIARRLAWSCEPCGSIAEDAGECARCGEVLTECWTYFSCPMHLEVGSERASDTCWKCGGMKLVLMRDEEEEEVEGIEGHHH